MELQACLNGVRGPDEHPALPCTPDELAADVVAVLHAVRSVAPAVPVGVTTGAWAVASE